MQYNCCGTPGYIAPEIIGKDNQVAWTYACDVFSVGVIFYRL